MVAERVVVAFAGDGAGEGELSWGQQDIWRAMVRQESWLPNGAWGALPPGTTLDDVVERLRYLMSRFPTARTRLRFGPDGAPRQVVSAAGEIDLEIVEAGDADPAALAERLRLRLQDDPYDFERDWPVRMAAVRHGGELTHLVVVMCHLVSDGLGTLVLLEELDKRPDFPVPDLQPLAQADWQASPSGARQNALALRHWESILQQMPLHRYREPRDFPSPRHWRGEFRSPALSLALRSLAARTGIASTTIALALFAVALTRVTGANPAVIRPMVNNRFRPGLDRVVCMLAQYGLCRLDVAGVSFAEVFDRARRSALGTYKHAYYDPVALDAVLDQVVTERPGLQLPCYFNDRRDDPTGAAAHGLGSAADGDGPSEDEVRAAADAMRAAADAVRAAAGGGEFRWTTRQDVPFEPLIVHLDEVAGGTQATIFLDTHVLGPDDAEALLRGLEAAAVEAALDPDARTGVPVAESGAAVEAALDPDARTGVPVAESGAAVEAALDPDARTGVPVAESGAAVEAALDLDARTGVPVAESGAAVEAALDLDARTGVPVAESGAAVEAALDPDAPTGVTAATESEAIAP